METQTAFDLNLAIQRWRENLARSAAFRSENLNELESHLRDSIDGLRTSRLSDEEAFVIAARRVGNAQKLDQEFAKVNGSAVWLDRCLWVFVAVQLWSLISGASNILLSVIAPFCMRMNDLLPEIGSQKIQAGWLQTGLALVFSPPFVALAVVLIWRFFVWPKRRGSVLLQRILRQPGLLAAALLVLCVIFQWAGAWAWQTLYYPAVFHRATVQDWQMRIVLMRIPTLVLWSGLTYFLARRRLRSSVA